MSTFIGKSEIKKGPGKALSNPYKSAVVKTW